MSDSEEVIFDPELGDLPIIFDDDSPEEKERKQKIIDDKMTTVAENEDY
jgi:hypothetical protein